MYTEKKMEAYLIKHPFTYKNLQVKLLIHDEKDDKVYHPDVRSITLREGNLYYRTLVQSANGFDKEKSYTNEAYEVATKRLGIWQND